MNTVRLSALLLVCFLLAGCSGMAQIFATPTPTLPPPTATPEPIPGIDIPIIIEGIEVQLTSLSRADKYEVPGGTQTFRPTSADDECLIIEASIDVDDTKVVQAWKVSVIDKNGRESTPNLTSTMTYFGGDKKNSVMWLLVIAKNSKSLILHLPGDQTIDLSPLDN